MADTTTSLNPTTELEATNTLLRCIGEGPISDVSNPENLSAIDALKTLRRVSREVQTRGWYFNYEYNVDYSRDEDNKIPVGTDVLEIDTYGKSKSRNVTRRGSYLYDLDNNTYTFTDDLKVELIRFLSFEDLPESARNYITVKAAREFQKDEIGEDGTKFGFDQGQEVQALMTLKKHEGRNADHNILTGSLRMVSIIDRTGQYGDLITQNTTGR